MAHDAVGSAKDGQSSWSRLKTGECNDFGLVLIARTVTCSVVERVFFNMPHVLVWHQRASAKSLTTQAIVSLPLRRVTF